MDELMKYLEISPEVEVEEPEKGESIVFRILEAYGEAAPIFGGFFAASAAPAATAGITAWLINGS